VKGIIRCFVLICLTLSTLCCNKPRYKFDSFEYGYNAYFDTSFTFMIERSDTICLKEKYQGHEKSFETILHKTIRIDLEKLLHEINFEELDTIYSSLPQEDGESYFLKVSKNGKIKSIQGDYLRHSEVNLMKKMKELKRELERNKIEANH
jgi:hypothetical protein